MRGITVAKRSKTPAKSKKTVPAKPKTSKSKTTAKKSKAAVKTPKTAVKKGSAAKKGSPVKKAKKAAVAGKKTPEVIRDDVLGELRFVNRLSPTLDSYSATVKIQGHEVDFDLYSDVKLDISPALNRAKYIVTNFLKVSAAARKFFQKEVLPLYNKVWREQDKPKATAARFDEMPLSCVMILADGQSTFDYDPGELFQEHSLWLFANENLEFEDFDLPG
jgi:hypothetical protein